MITRKRAAVVIFDVKYNNIIKRMSSCLYAVYDFGEK